MKRYVLLLCVLLNCVMLKAQSVTYTCRYWFDQNHAQAATISFSDSNWQAELDVGALSKGFHKFHLQMADTSMIWSSPRIYLFYKAADSLQEDLTCCYWFDQNHAQIQNLSIGNGHLLLNVSDLEEGLHTVNVLLEGDALTTTTRYVFMKAPVGNPYHGYQYHCWFDQDFEHRQTDSLGDGHFLLDVSELVDGLHTVNVLLEGDALTTTTRYVFMKMPVGNPFTEYQYHCWFDNDLSTMQTGLLGSGCFQLNVDSLTNGFHTVIVQLDDNGKLSVPQHYMFYKRPFGGYITKWEYWLNGDTDNRHTTDLSPYVDTLDIITLLPLETWPIRSTCFHFQPNGDEPYIIAKNEITLRFWDVDKHFFDKSSFYIDENIVEPIVADTLERNTIVSINAPRNNQIHWFKLDANRGEYLSFQADKACTMQLFAPSGEEVYAASGPESIVLGGFNVWEDGTYYLAVHDVMGSGETVSVTYNWIYRYSILSYDVHLVGNGGCSTITFQGNGFNSLLDAYLVNWQNDTIRQLDIGHESNTTTTISFNFYEENLGVYDAVFEFFEETIRINGALEVQEPVDIVLTSSVSHPWAFVMNTPCTYTYTITNNGNMSAYGVPIYVYISTQTLEGISHLELSGFGLSSILDGIELDSLSQNVILDLKAWAKDLGDDHRFFKTVGFEETTGDTVIVRSNYFFLNLAPYESRTLTITITSSENVSVWMTIPSDTITPVNFQENRYSLAEFCCVADKISCGVNIVCAFLDFIDGLHLAGPWMSITACACDLFSAGFTEVSTILCVGPTIDYAGFWDKLAFMSAMHSLLKVFVGCMIKSGFLGIFDFAKYKETIENVVKALTNLTLTENAFGCLHAFTESKPNCPPGDHKGGKSLAGVWIAMDPNDIHGYISESGSQYMRQEIQNMWYEIEFENDSTLATAAARTIIVRDTLDATRFDLNSLAARSVTIGDKRLDLNGEQTFARTLDLRPEINVIAQVEQDYDPTTGIVEWTIQSLDPMTMEPTDDPNQGVLPVNYNGNGVGFIDYSIDLKEAFADGTEISNRAGIIFDQNDVIMTPTWTNTVDAVKPTSHIEEVTPMADSLNFVFVSQDNRSGVWYHSLYYRNASTEQEWQVRKAQIFEDSFVLHLEDLLTTEYLVIAVDSAGNREDKDMVAEYIYTASGLHFVSEGNWSTASNWQEGTLPEADDVAFINAPCQLDQDAEVAALAISDDQTLTVQSGKTLTVNGLLFNPSAEGLVIEDGAQLINATSNVAATMEKGIAAYPSSGPDGWYTIASPMDEMPIAESDFLTPNFDLYRFDETNLTHEEWQNYKANHPDFATFEKGRGYLYANSNSFAPAFMGTLSNTAATYHLTYTERPDALSGFNLIGNPFPHVIYKGAGGAIDNAQLASGYYTLTNEGAWHVHTYEDAIMPGQGILVKTMADLDLTIAKSNATALSESSDAKASSSRVVLKVSGSWGEDRAFVYFGQGIGLDKMENLSRSVPSLWIRDNGHDYAIAHVDSDCESLELLFSNMQSGDFTLSVDVSDTSFSVLQLTDRITGVTIDLLQQPSYVFHSAGQENEARFSLTFKMETMR